MKYLVILLVLAGLVGPAFALGEDDDYTEEILILVENEVRKVYYTGENIISVLADPESASVIFETGKNAKLEVKVPQVYKDGPGLLILRNGEEVDVVIGSDECFFYATIETQKPEKTEIIYAFWPEYPETVENCETFTVAPLKQIHLGVLPEDVQCHDDNVLVFKSSNDSPACVKSESVMKLIERKWAKPIPSMFRDDPNVTDTLPLDISDVDPTKIIDANNQFAVNFYSQVTADKEENVFFSPWSISTAFAIAYEGARGNTAEQMSDAFGFVKDDDERRNTFMAIHEDLNQKNAKYKLNIANALWLAPDFEPFPEYVNTAKTYYDSEVASVNLAGNGVDIINDWVKTKTEEKIEELFMPGSLTVNTRMIITNAIYFNGTWVMPFDERYTSEQDFVINSQKTVKVPMMSQDSFFNFTSTDDLQIFELPYEGDRLSMLILLPKKMDGIKSLEESLSAQKISQWNDDLFERRLQVQIPKFIMETDYDLIPGLKKMGINDAFGPADFSGISNSGLFIAKAIHKAFVDVNEKGTEAAAATGIVMDESAPPSFRADHPFIFIIQDKETGNILFIGKVVDPTSD